MMDENFQNSQSSMASKPKNRVRGVVDFLLVIRDRWLLALTRAVPV